MKLIIQLSAKNKVFSRLIQWGTRGEFDHVDIVMSDGALIGAHLFGGIKKTKMKDINFFKTKRYEIEVSEGTIIWVKQQIGRKYDIMAILGFIFKIPVRETTASICSAFAFDVIEKSSAFYSNTDFNSAEISPRDLHLILKVLNATGCAKLI